MSSADRAAVDSAPDALEPVVPEAADAVVPEAADALEPAVPEPADDLDRDALDAVPRPSALARAKALWCQLVSGLG